MVVEQVSSTDREQALMIAVLQHRVDQRTVEVLVEPARAADPGPGRRGGTGDLTRLSVGMSHRSVQRGCSSGSGERSRIRSGSQQRIRSSQRSRLRPMSPVLV